MKTHANAIGLPLFLPERKESVLLGSAMLAAVVSNFYPDVTAAAKGMAGPASQIEVDANAKE